MLITKSDLPLKFDHLSKILGLNLNLILAKLKLSENGSDTFISFDNRDISNLLFIRTKNPDTNPVERFREVGHAIQKYLKQVKGKKVHILFNNIDTDLIQATRGVTEGLLLSDYKFLEFKSPSPDEIPDRKDIIFLLERQNKITEIRRQLRRTEAILNGVNVARTLANKPANVLNPKKLAREVQKLYHSVPSVKVDVIQGKKLESLGMNAFLSVAKGSKQSPTFILMRYKFGIKNAPILAVLGKGITFDSGGISIKPAEGMEEMKYDMAGAATVIGLFKVLSVLKPDIDIIGAIPAAENALGGDAYRPGDIIRSYNGQTIEVVNTDAEGRLILADSLAYVEKRFHPDWMIDIATLTGSIVSALGDQCCGIFSNNDFLLQSFKHAAELSGERVWPMPMWDEYKKPLESKVADIKHLGGRSAGSITAAKFLETFVSDSPWLHMDIAGTAYNVKSKKYLGEGASGFGVRLLWEVIDHLQKISKVK